ncbi:MAG: site-specific DNA-methyltransferase, partial [Candidatus Binatia bacterium]
EEWVDLFAIDEIAGDADRPGYSVPLTPAFLTANPNLVLDTWFFGAGFTACLLSTIDDLDATLDGLLIHGDNFQALRLLERQLHERVKCVYIDPPYNSSSSAIPYKNDYRHSSWITMMRDRLALLHSTLTDDGAIFVSIDKAERTGLEHALDDVFGSDNRVEELIWSMNTTNSQVPNYSTNHEYVEVYARDRRVAEQDPTMFREPKPGFEEVTALVNELNPSYPSIFKVESEIRALYERHKIQYREEIEAQGLDWDDHKGNDPWKGLFNYSHAEYRDAACRLVSEAEAKDRQAEIWVWASDNPSMPATKQAASTQDPGHPNYRFYKPLHPITGKPTPHPKSGWKFAYDDDADSPDKRSFVSRERDGRIVWGPDEKNVPRVKRFLREVETNIGKSVFHDNSDGEKQTSAMFGRSGVFLAPKHSSFVSRFILHAAKPDSVILDCFAGTGSTAHAVIDLNRADGGTRKYILAEVGEYFDTVLKPRVLKAIYSKDWRNGKPLSRQGSRHALKYLRLESYEDALMNVSLQAPDSAQQILLDSLPALREDYLLHYALPAEAEGSPSLLAVERFAEPFAYRLSIFRPGASNEVVVDLPETFTWLLGLTVEPA